MSTTIIESHSTTLSYIRRMALVRMYRVLLIALLVSAFVVCLASVLIPLNSVWNTVLVLYQFVGWDSIGFLVWAICIRHTDMQPFANVRFHA